MKICRQAIAVSENRLNAFQLLLVQYDRLFHAGLQYLTGVFQVFRFSLTQKYSLKLNLNWFRTYFPNFRLNWPKSHFLKFNLYWISLTQLQLMKRRGGPPHHQSLNWIWKLKVPLNKNSSKTTPDLFAGIGTNSRPYVNIEIRGTKIHWVIDTCSSRAHLGPAGLQILGSRGYKIDYSKAGAVMMANGSIEMVIGETCLPSTFLGTIHSIHFKIIPELTDTYLLVMDFAEKFGFILKVRYVTHPEICRTRDRHIRPPTYSLKESSHVTESVWCVNCDSELLIEKGLIELSNSELCNRW